MRWIVVGVVAVAGCEGAIRQVGPGSGRPDDTGTVPTTWRCDHRDTDGRCFTYLGEGWDDGSRSADCAPAIPEQGTCGSDGAIGTCTFLPADPLAKGVTFYAGTYYTSADADFLRADCEINFGVWGSAGT